MIDYPAALAVKMVVQTGSFEQAAKALHVTPSAISQRVKIIEERLGVSLIERGSPCVATEKGEWLCRHLEHVSMLESELAKHLPNLTEMRSSAMQRITINIAVNADSIGTWFLKAMAPFVQDTGYLLSIAIDDEDYTAEWLERGRVLAAVTSLSKPIKGCRVSQLGALRYQATATPTFIEKHFTNGIAEGIAKAPALSFNQKDRLQQEWINRTMGRTINMPTHRIPSTQGFIDACLAGMGWGMNPVHIVHEHIKSGRLVELVPDSALEIPLFWQVNHLAANELTNLTRQVTQVAKQFLIQPT